MGYNVDELDNNIFAKNGKTLLEGIMDTRPEDMNKGQCGENVNYVIDDPEKMVGKEPCGNLEFLHKDRMHSDLSLMVNTWIYNEIIF